MFKFALVSSNNVKVKKEDIRSSPNILSIILYTHSIKNIVTIPILAILPKGQVPYFALLFDESTIHFGRGGQDVLFRPEPP